MVKNLMNNPWFVGALGLFASIYLGWSVAQPLLFNDSQFASGDPEFIPGLEQDEATTVAQDASVQSVQREQIRWLHEVERDPFASMAPTLLRVNPQVWCRL